MHFEIFEIGQIILELLRFFKGLSECEWTLVTCMVEYKFNTRF